MPPKKSPKSSPKSSPKTPAKVSPKSAPSAKRAKTAEEVRALVRAAVTKDGAVQLAAASSDDARSRVVDWVSTQSLEIDALLRVPGLPTGRIVELVGKPHAGKTTGALHVVAEVQRRGGVAYYRDREDTLDEPYAKRIGVDTSTLELIQPKGPALEDDVEAIEETIDALKPTGALAVIVYDSVAGASTRGDLGRKFGESQPGAAAKQIRQMCRRLVAKLAGTRILLLVLNQTYTAVGKMFGNPETAYGGDGLTYFASIILHFKLAGKLPNDVDGTISRVEVWKNKLQASSRRKADVAFARGRGYDNVYAIFTTLEEQKLIEHAAQGWCRVRISESEECRWRGGWPGLVTHCAANPDVFGRLADAFRAIHAAALPPPDAKPDADEPDPDADDETK